MAENKAIENMFAGMTTIVNFSNPTGLLVSGFVTMTSKTS